MKTMGSVDQTRSYHGPTRAETPAVAAPPPRPVVPASKIQPGMILGRYEILTPLASGGMADVWIGAVSPQRDPLVAVKTMRTEMATDPVLCSMFIREARLASSIDHPNVVRVHDVGEYEGIPYQVMTLVEGESLSLLRRIHRGPIPVGIIGRVMLDTLAGLHAAHVSTDERGLPRGLIHRDVSPLNILVGIDGVARLTDFGIAKAVFSGDEKTQTGVLRGTPGYMSPEQVRRKKGIDHRSDIFACGIVLWELITGVRLFAGEDILDIFERIGAARIPAPQSIVPNVNEALAAVALRALARDPADRFASADEMARDLRRALGSELATVETTAIWVKSLVGAEIVNKLEAARTTKTTLPARLYSTQEIIDRRTRRRIFATVGIAAVMGVGVALMISSSRSEVQLLPSAESASASATQTIPSATATEDLAIPIATILPAHSATAPVLPSATSTTVPTAATTAPRHSVPTVKTVKTASSAGPKLPFDDNPFQHNK